MIEGLEIKANKVEGTLSIQSWGEKQELERTNCHK